MPQGYVVEVSPDGIVVAVDSADLEAIGLPGTFVKIEKGRKKLIGIVSGVSLTEEVYRSARGRIPLIETYRELALKKNEIFVTPLATEADGVLERKISLIPSPGDVVVPLSKEELEGIFAHGDIRIGRLINQDVEVKLNINELATKHLAILAMTGSGKSNTLAVLVMRILEKFSAPRFVIIDTHSEYIGLSRVVPDKVKLFAPTGDLYRILKSQGYDPMPMEIPYWILSLEEWYSLLRLDSRATVQRRILRTALRDVKRGDANAPEYFEIDELKRSLMGFSAKPAEEVLAKVEDAVETPEYGFIFEPTSSLRVKDDPMQVLKGVLKPLLLKGVSIISLGGLPTDVQNTVVSALLRFLFRFLVEGKIHGAVFPTIIAIEEAHIYAPADTWTAAKNILERIAKEGRKFGVGLVIVSQRPREISQTVLAQCGNLIALRTVNPEDKRHILLSMEDISDVMTASLSSLGRGEALLTGPFVPIPAMVKIDRFEDVAMEVLGREVRLGGKDVDFRREWEEEPDESELERILRSLLESAEAERRRRKRGGGGPDLTQFFGGGG